MLVQSKSASNEYVEAQREHLIRTAIRLFTKKGYHNTTTRELATACNMSIGGIYYYIGAKEDIPHLVAQRMIALVDQTTARLTAELEHFSPTEAFRRSIGIYYELVDHNRDYWRFMNAETKVFRKKDFDALYDVHLRKVEYFEKLFERGIQAGEFWVRHPALLARDVTTLFPAWVTRHWLLKGTYRSINEYARQQTELLLDAIRIPKGNDSRPAGNGSHEVPK
ncbi:MAG: TetR/AcrR family transcriptional regulator [Dehalococcoidia bacterium]|nr:TetR/AcrR family transcriptional regulator [Dehalococcoidia bacterium]